MSDPFTALGGETVYSGRLVQVRIERFRHVDGEEVSREVVRHQGAVGVVAHDEREVWEQCLQTNNIGQTGSSRAAA